jgi:hypothetical protein
MQYAVNPKPDPDIFLLAFQVDIAGFQLIGLLDKIGQHIIRPDLVQVPADLAYQVFLSGVFGDLDIFVFDFFGRVIKQHIIVEAGFGND